MVCLFHVLANTNMDNIQLTKIAAVAIQPDILLRLPGKQQLIKNASSGNSTAA